MTRADTTKERHHLAKLIQPTPAAEPKSYAQTEQQLQPAPPAQLAERTQPPNAPNNRRNPHNPR
eukprot:11162272-Lingulodinium_polyedra.AAC.1